LFGVEKASGPVQETSRSSHEPGTLKLYVKVEWTEGKAQPRRKKEKRKKSDGSMLLWGRWGKERRREGYPERESNR